MARKRRRSSEWRLPNPKVLARMDAEALCGLLPRSLPPQPELGLDDTAPTPETPAALAEAIRGAGAAATPAPRFLPPVWSAEDGLDARQVRVALRAWRTRDTGDPDRQAALQAELPGTPADAEALVRWLAGQATLRRAELLLRAWRARLSPRVGVSPRSPR